MTYTNLHQMIVRKIFWRVNPLQTQCIVLYWRPIWFHGGGVVCSLLLCRTSCANVSRKTAHRSDNLIHFYVTRPRAILQRRQTDIIGVWREVRFWLELKCWQIPEWFYSTPRLCHRCYNGLRVLAGFLIPITGLYQLWEPMVCLPSASANYSPPYQTPQQILA